MSKNTELNPPRGEMIEYLKQAIGEGYQPEYEAAVSDLAVIDDLQDNDLNREFGKCWQWYNMGGGMHETIVANYTEEQRFNAKLQCLDKAFLQSSAFSKPGAEGLADAINAGFDKISKPFIMPGEPVKVIEKDLFVAAVEPLMKYLSENHHPHTSVMVNSTTSELVTGEMVHNTDKYLRD